MELLKVGDNQVRIVTKGPKDSDHTVTLDNEVEEEDPFENMVKVYTFLDKQNIPSSWILTQSHRLNISVPRDFLVLAIRADTYNEKQVSLTKKCHNHRPHNPWYGEEKTKNQAFS